MKKLFLVFFFSGSILCRFPFVSALAADDKPEPALSDAEKIYGLSLFWKEVSYNFANFAHVSDLDWDMTYREFIPRVLSTRNTYEYYRELQRFCALLKDGHTNVYFPDSILAKFVDYPPILLQEIDHRAFVPNVDSSLVLSLPIGSEIVAVDGVELKEYLREKVFPYLSTSTEQILWDWGIRFNAFGFGLLAGSPGSSVELTVVNPSGERHKVSVTRDCQKRKVRPFLAPAAVKGLVEFEWVEKKLAYVALNSFDNPTVVDEFKAIVPVISGAEGIIIDLRNNPGGSTDNCKPIASYLTEDRMIGAAWRTKKHVAAYKAWGSFGRSEYSDYFKGDAWVIEAPDTIFPEPGKKLKMPIVILIGRNTGSAAEDFLIYLDPLENITLVGEPTFGSTGQPLLFDLPGGGKARICTKHDYFPDGREFVGYGIQPDFPVHITPEDMLSGRDPVRVKGLEVLKEKVKARSVGE